MLLLLCTSEFNLDRHVFSQTLCWKCIQRTQNAIHAGSEREAGYIQQLLLWRIMPVCLQADALQLLLCVQWYETWTVYKRFFCGLLFLNFKWQARSVSDWETEDTAHLLSIPCFSSLNCTINSKIANCSITAETSGQSHKLISQR